MKTCYPEFRFARPWPVLAVPLAAHAPASKLPVATTPDAPTGGAAPGYRAQAGAFFLQHPV